jgi:hypothetical protein
MSRSAFSGMMSGLKDRLWGDSGVSSVHGTLGATMEPPAHTASAIDVIAQHEGGDSVARWHTREALDARRGATSASSCKHAIGMI